MHLTVRMAWHDNNWNGRICENPAKNTYCVGTHSLLADRIATNRETVFEEENKGELISEIADYTVPCFWSINAFSNQGYDVIHRHAFSGISQTIKETVKPYSVFTWPFKHSFNHDEETKKRYGNYPPDLERRVNSYIQKFEPKKSIIFFYANYDNPVSGDEMKYLLIGCSVIAEQPEPTYFPLSEEELNDWRSKPKMRYFPKMNWALQFTHLFEEYGVLLPYSEYLSHVEQNPEDEEKLQDMKVVIDEPSLISSFKYVSMDIDDDKCLFLLYKLRKSLLKIKEHGLIVDSQYVENQLEHVNTLIKMTWEKRGLFPSLPHILRYFEMEEDAISAVYEWVEERKGLQLLITLLKEEEVPEELEEYEDDLLEFFEQTVVSNNIEVLKMLGYIQLTQYQLTRILKNIRSYRELITNPYVLCEDYIADDISLDRIEELDEPIDIFKIDIAMIPDRKYMKRDKSDPKMKADSPERLRTVIVNHLYHIGETRGDCYEADYTLIEMIKQYPLFYKTGIQIDEDAILQLDKPYRQHFLTRLYMNKKEGITYYSLMETYQAESLIRNTIEQLTKREDYQVNISYDDYIQESLEKLKGIDKKVFEKERVQLYSTVYRKSLYVLTGKAGSGKTMETTKIISSITEDLREEVVVVAPTGKAALRLSEKIQKTNPSLRVEPRTIDRFIFKQNFGQFILDRDYRQIFKVPEERKIVVPNLIIDESSMIDLFKFAMLLSFIRIDKLKRLILVGDPYQLPPIGFGKPFRDIIDHLIETKKIADNHFIRLISNCRMVAQQEKENKSLELAEIYTAQGHFYEPILAEVDMDEYDSDTLQVQQWQTAEDLQQRINSTVEQLFESAEQDRFETMNMEMGLYKDTGYVQQNNPETIHLDGWQIVSPYRAGHFGTISLNKLTQTEWRKPNKPYWPPSSFVNGDKIIRLNNWYNKGRLILSNGSIGLVTFHSRGKEKKLFFKETNSAKYFDAEENFELAYAISVHKSQGSDFDYVFLVLPRKYGLLTKEMIYTGLTRARKKVFLFVQASDEKSLLQISLERSSIENRNTSIFTEPSVREGKYQPKRGVSVKSKVEYIIYKALEQSGLLFEYEKEFELPHQKYNYQPDFTIQLSNGETYYWEHLGLLNDQNYYNTWLKRRTDYETMKVTDNLITTDDMDGINIEKIQAIIEGIKTQSLLSSDSTRYSHHHYSLK